MRADIYSLGAILYEILSGKPPFADPASSPQSVRELLRRISEDEPIPPRQLAAGVPPALEAICLKSLEKDPAERYAGAAELGQEVQRWLADEPVRVYREPFLARLGRWARRNRALVNSLGVLLLTTLIGVSVFAVVLDDANNQLGKANGRLEVEKAETDKALKKVKEANEQLEKEKIQTVEARNRAERNFLKAKDAVDKYLTKISEERLLNVPGFQDLRRELLATAKTFHEDFTREQGNDPASREALARADFQLASILDDLGERVEAIAVLQHAQKTLSGFAGRAADLRRIPIWPGPLRFEDWHSTLEQRWPRQGSGRPVRQGPYRPRQGRPAARARRLPQRPGSCP